ncbi:MAG: fibronectin type III domain-containing protein, partial [Eggerthella lenta]
VSPVDQAVEAGEQATFAAFTNRGNAEDVSYEWQYRALGSLEDAWEAIPHATGRVVTLDAGTIGYVRCVAMQATPATPAAEVVPAVEVAEAAPVAEVAPTTETPKVGETGEVAKTAETSATTEANEALAANESFGANEALEADVPEEMLGAAETNEAPAVPEIAETLAAPAPVVVYSNEARVRVTPSAPENLAVGEVGFRDAALSWGASDMPDSTFTLAYRAVGTDEWTEAAGLTAPAHKLDGLAPGTRYEWRVQTVVVEEGDALASAWAYGDSFTTQTMKTYPVTAGSDGTWKPGQPGLSFTVDAPRDKFLSLVVDGAELVQDVDYALAADGMTVTLSPDYLAKLAVGKHALVAMFTDGTASASFTVAPADPGPTPNPPDPPNPPGPTPTPDPPTPTPLPDDGGKKLAPTGDPLTVALPLIGCLALASACAAIMACRWKRRRP